MKLANVSLMFFKMMHRVSYDQNFLEKYGIDGFLSVNLVSDHPPLEIP